MNNEQRTRERFEAWARTEGMRMRRDRELGQYLHPKTEGAWLAYRSRDAEVQALREALEQANARLRVLAGDIHSVWLRDIDVALTGGRQALPTTADVIGILREEGTDDE